MYWLLKSWLFITEYHNDRKENFGTAWTIKFFFCRPSFLLENVPIFEAEHSSPREGCGSQTLQLIDVFSFSNYSFNWCTIQGQDLGFLLLKDGNNLGILFDSLVSVPKFCLRENYCQLRRLRKIFILFRLCCCGNLLR